MVAAGCVMARVCHTNNCPVGGDAEGEAAGARRGEPEGRGATRICGRGDADILKKLRFEVAEKQSAASTCWSY